MAKALSATDLLLDSSKLSVPAVCALFGDDDFLRRQLLRRLRDVVLPAEEGEFAYTEFSGDDAELADVLADLRTIAMFGGGRRLTAVLEADGFVSRYRPELEDYVAKPLRTGTLVLSLKTLASNTRLYKAILASGLLISCAAPSAAALSGWLGHWARHVHAVELKPSVAETLIELIGPEIGLLDQELAKLALAVGNDKRVTDELVDRLVRAGAWRAKTAWEMLDFVLDGDARAAMVQLDRLLASGEQPLGILAQVSYSLRRFAAATRLVLQAEAAGKRITPRDALAQVGTKPFILQRAEGQLRRLGRVRGAQLYDWLLEADLDMKGQSPLPPRLILERLFLRLAAPAPQPAAR